MLISKTTPNSDKPHQKSAPAALFSLLVLCFFRHIDIIVRRAVSLINNQLRGAFLATYNLVEAKVGFMIHINTSKCASVKSKKEVRTYKSKRRTVL